MAVSPLLFFLSFGLSVVERKRICCLQALPTLYPFMKMIVGMVCVPTRKILVKMWGCGNLAILLIGKEIKNRQNPHIYCIQFDML